MAYIGDMLASEEPPEAAVETAGWTLIASCSGPPLPQGQPSSMRAGGGRASRRWRYDPTLQEELSQDARNLATPPPISLLQSSLCA
jgi:hypothetical protein